jgi:hypothetical protein
VEDFFETAFLWLSITVFSILMVCLTVVVVAVTGTFVGLWQL